MGWACFPCFVLLPILRHQRVVHTSSPQPMSPTSSSASLTAKSSHMAAVAACSFVSPVKSSRDNGSCTSSEIQLPLFQFHDYVVATPDTTQLSCTSCKGKNPYIL